MASLRERLKMKGVIVDEWIYREKYYLLAAVRRCGDGNWVAIRESMIGHTIPGEKRPSDWYSTENCKIQYKLLLEEGAAEAPKRRKRGSTVSDTEAIRELMEKKYHEIFLRRNAADRDATKVRYRAGEEIIYQILETPDDEKATLEVLYARAAELTRQRKFEENRWMREREERVREMSRLNLQIRGSSISEAGSEPASPLNEPLAVDVPDELPIKVEKPPPANTPTSPLLTRLLNSAVPRAASPPSIVPSTATASILHSAITSPRAGTPTISSLLNSPSSVPPSNGSPVKNVTPVAAFDDPAKILLSPSQGAPTLSMLLEMPPSVPGKPLPVLPPAPPPYAEHLGPPPPYSLAKEYLQIQKQREAQQAILNVEKELIQATASIGSGPIAITSPIKSALKSDVLVDLDDIEEVIAGDTTRSQFNITGLSNPSDHDYNLIKPRIEDILPEPSLPVILAGHIPEQEVASPAPTSTPVTPADVDRKPPKKLDVFEFGEEEENDTNMTYKRSVAKRLAEKEAKMAGPVKTKIEDDVLVDVETQQDDTEDTDPPSSPLHEEVVETDTMESEEIVMFEIKPPDAEVVEVVDEVVDGSHITEEGEIDPDMEDCDTKDGILEQLEEEPMGEVKQRRLTVSISNSDSVPNSPAATTDEDKDWKAWKRSVLLCHNRIEGHKSASLFLKPIADPKYLAAVKRPIDLSGIKRNIEGGLVRSSNEYKRDVMMMFLNARMYNKLGSVVYQEAAKMQTDSLEHIKALDEVLDDAPPTKRELRAHEKTEKVAIKRQSRQSLRGSVEAKKIVISRK